MYASENEIDDHSSLHDNEGFYKSIQNYDEVYKIQKKELKGIFLDDQTVDHPICKDNYWHPVTEHERKILKEAMPAYGKTTTEFDC